jgi:DNA-binding transcriptional LysR family regulator
MHLDAMKIFCDVVETASFSRAGTLNALTQTAVSRKIQAIEEYVGYRLLERSKGRRRIAPTEAGSIYYQGCRELLRRHQQLVDSIGEAQGEVTGTVRVETVYSVGLHELQQPVKDFLRLYPKARIHLEYNRTNRIYDDCLLERCDIGIVAYPAEQPRIAAIPLARQRLVLICSPDNVLARRRAVRFADLKTVPFVAFEADIPTRKAIDRHAREAGVALAVAMEFDNIETIKRSVEVGLGVSVVPLGTVEVERRAGTLCAIPLLPRCERTTGIIHKRGRAFSLSTTRFIEILASQRRPASQSPS